MIFLACQDQLNKRKEPNNLRPMYGVNSINSTLPDPAPIYSPVTLSSEWPKVGRLTFMATASAWGATLNGFFVASFFVECSLRKAGHTFLACVGMADLLITGGMMFISAVVLLAGEWDNIYVCNVLQLLGLSSSYSYSLFFLLAAAENYLRLCFSKATYDLLINDNVRVITVTIFAISFILGGVGVYLGLDYDYCKRSYGGNNYFRALSTILLHVLPSGLTTFCMIRSFQHVRRRAMKRLSYRRSLAYECDYSIVVLNIVAYCLYFIAWLPYLINSLDLEIVSDAKYYNSIWMGLGRSMITSIFYAIFNRNFRRAFAHLFNYCCCKNSLSRPLATRHRREYTRRFRTTVRVLHPNMFIARSAQLHGPYRAASTYRDTQNL